MKINMQKKNGMFFCWAAAMLMLAASFIMTGCQQPAGGSTGSGIAGNGEKVLVKYDSSKISIRAKKADNSWGFVSPNDKISAGTLLSFRPRNIPAGQQVDKWKVNEKELGSSAYTVNAADAADEAGQKVITITYTTKDAAPVIVKFDPSKVDVFKEGSGSIHNGDIVYEGTDIFFQSKNIPAGQQVDKWKVNEKELRGNRYRVNAADAADEAGQKVITITYTTKDAAPVIVKFDPSKVDVFKEGSPIQSGNTVYEGTVLLFRLKNIPAGQQFDKWKINAEESTAFSYRVNAADAVDEAGQKVITISYTTKDAAPVIVKFDPSKVEVFKYGNSSIGNGDTVYEGTPLNFHSKNIPAGQQVDKWKVNAKVLVHSGYLVNAADAVDEAGQKVITITYTLK